MLCWRCLQWCLLPRSSLFRSWCNNYVFTRDVGIHYKLYSFIFQPMNFSQISKIVRYQVCSLELCFGGLSDEKPGLFRNTVVHKGWQSRWLALGMILRLFRCHTRPVTGINLIKNYKRNLAPSTFDDNIPFRIASIGHIWICVGSQVPAGWIWCDFP